MKNKVRPTSDEKRLKAKSAALRFAEERDIETDGRHLIDTLLFDQPCYVAWEGEATAIIFYETDPGTAVTIMNRPGPAGHGTPATGADCTGRCRADAATRTGAKVTPKRIHESRHVMSAHAIQQWRKDMSQNLGVEMISYRAAAKLLGLSHAGYLKLESQGAPLYIAYACAALLADLDPYMTTTKTDMRWQQRGFDLKAWTRPKIKK